LDHVEPLSRGGADTVDNTAPVCFGCNSSKGPLFLLEWVWVRAGLLTGGKNRPLGLKDPPRHLPAQWTRSVEHLAHQLDETKRRRRVR
jgi:hypothetical protein